MNIEVLRALGFGQYFGDQCVIISRKNYATQQSYLRYTIRSQTFKKLAFVAVFEFESKSTCSIETRDQLF